MARPISQLLYIRFTGILFCLWYAEEEPENCRDRTMSITTEVRLRVGIRQQQEKKLPQTVTLSGRAYATFVPDARLQGSCRLSQTKLAVPALFPLLQVALTRCVR